MPEEDKDYYENGNTTTSWFCEESKVGVFYHLSYKIKVQKINCMWNKVIF